jgi:hypothetical protein
MSWKVKALAMALLILPLSALHAQNDPLLKIGPEAVWQGDEKKLS